MQQNGTGTPPL